MKQKVICQPKYWKSEAAQRQLKRRITTDENHQRQTAKNIANLAIERADLLCQELSCEVSIAIHILDSQIERGQTHYKELGQKLNVLRLYCNV